jgi:hypothetical protein
MPVLLSKTSMLSLIAIVSLVLKLNVENITHLFAPEPPNKTTVGIPKPP